MRHLPRHRKGVDMGPLIQADIKELLTLAGARIQGRRADCPDCGSRRTVSIDEARRVFYCHHAGCEFRGGVGTLERRLGIERERIPRSQYVQKLKTQQRAAEASERLAHACRARQFELLARLRALGALELAAHNAGPSEVAWEILSTIYHERPGVEQELECLETGSAACVFEALSGNFEADYPQKTPHFKDGRQVSVCL